MSQYILKRFLTIVPVLVGISIIVFGFIHLIPGDPAVTMLGERATPERVKEVRAQLGLDRPLYARPERQTTILCSFPMVGASFRTWAMA